MKTRAAEAAPRSALTLIELLLVLALVGTLMALLLVAVQKARDAAARTHCANNLRQIGLALHQFHGSSQAFPTGFRSGLVTTTRPWSGWPLDILPYLEQDALAVAADRAYRTDNNPFNDPPHVGLTQLVPSYLCPADARICSPQVTPKRGLRVAFTSYLGVSGRDHLSNDGVLFASSRVRIADITDGTSTTLLVGERPPSADLVFGWWYAGSGQASTGSGDFILGVEQPNLLPVRAGSCPPGRYGFAPGQFRNAEEITSVPDGIISSWDGGGCSS